MSNVYESKHPLVAHKLTHLRNRETKSKKFRELIREISALLTYEATADLRTAPRQVETPLTTTTGQDLQQPIGLVPILRAGNRHGRGCLGADAQRRGVAHRPVPG